MKQTTMLCAAIAVVASAASAQNDKTKNPPSAQTPPAVSKTDLKKGLPFCHKASEVVGSKVKNAAGEDLGNVEELVLDPSSGSIEYAVVSFGGFLGMGEKLFAVPFSMLRAPEVPEGDKLAHFTMNVDKARLEKAPGFDKNNWPDVNAATWSDEIDKYYGVTRNRMGDDINAPKTDKDNKDAGKAIDQNKKFHLVKASDVLGATIENRNNDNVGEVKELVLDPGRSKAVYFVLKAGGFLGMGEKLFAVPWTALKIDVKESNKTKFVLDVPKERFEKAPEYKDTDWTRMRDPNWIEEVYGYYGSRPYWKTGTGAGAPR